MSTSLAPPRSQPGPSVARARRFLSVRTWLLAIGIVALVVRIALVLATPNFQPQTDAADYDRIAETLALYHQFPISKLALTPGPTALRGPAFPIMLAGVYKIVGPLDAQTRLEAARLVEAALGALAVVLIFLIALRLFGLAAAVLSSGIAAVYPPLVMVGSSVMSESLFIPLVLAAVLAALIHRDSPHRWRWALVSGVALGLAALTRANVLLLAISLGVLVWTERPRWSRRALRAPLALLAATLVTVTPWLIRDAITFHQFVPLTTEGGFALVGEYNKYAAARTDYPAEWIPPILQIGELGPNAKTMNEAQLDTRLTSMALDYMKAHPGYVAKAVLWNAIRMFNLSGTKFELSIADSEVYPRWLASLSVYTFWALALLAIAGAFTPAARRAPRGFWWCPALLLLASVFIIGSTRYRSPADPFFLILAALALTDGWRRLRGRRSPVPSTAA